MLLFPGVGVCTDLRMHTITTKWASSELCLDLSIFKESNVSIFRIISNYLSLLPFFDSLDYMSRNTTECQRNTRHLLDVCSHFDRANRPGNFIWYACIKLYLFIHSIGHGAIFWAPHLIVTASEILLFWVLAI